jgi:hypothetical protein
MTSLLRNLRVAAALAAAFVVLGVAPALPVQGRTPVGVRGHEISLSVDRTSLVQLPLAASHVALHWAGQPGARVSISLSSDGATFGAPIAVEPTDGVGAGTETYSAVLWAGGASAARIDSDRPLGRVTVVAIDANAPTRFAPATSYTAAAAVAQPAVITRAGWGADESLRLDSSGNELWPPQFYPVQKLIVHHTAGRNGDPDPAATVRAIYYYNAVTQGWGDMGYNFLIDEAGHIYEGRHSRTYAAGEIPTGEDAAGNGVTGAHVYGYNSGTVGIGLLGTLTNQDATPAARDALEQLLAWKAERHAIDPLGGSLYTNPVSGTQKTFANVSGHRDLAATECPGGTFYATFPQLRQAVATRISGTPPAQTVPGAATLSATKATTGKGIRLDWTVPADGGSPITEYRVLRLNNGSFSRIATVSGTTTSYRDMSTKRGRTYTYVVRAVNALGVGPDSNQASAIAR